MTKPTVGRATKQLTIAVVGGGTGGHVAPALAVAEALRMAGHKVVFIGSATGPEKKIVGEHKLPFYGIQAGKLRRYFDLQNIVDAFRVLIGLWQAYWLLRHLQPAALFSKGGYVAVPVIYAADFLTIPIVAHESDAVMGLANRLATAKARRICTGFPVNNYPVRLQRRLRFTGNPVRQIFRRRFAIPKLITKYGLNPKLPIVLVTGGSQGSQSINQLIFDLLNEGLRELQIIHLTGVNHLEAAEAVRNQLPKPLQKRYLIFDHVGESMAELLAMATIVISRAGGAISELATMGKAVILIPLPTAASDHQRANATILKKARAAIVLEEGKLHGYKLLKQIRDLLDDKEQLQQLRHNITYFRSPKAAQLIAETVVESINVPDERDSH